MSIPKRTGPTGNLIATVFIIVILLVVSGCPEAGLLDLADETGADSDGTDTDGTENGNGSDPGNGNDDNDNGYDASSGHLGETLSLPTGTVFWAPPDNPFLTNASIEFTSYPGDVIGSGNVDTHGVFSGITIASIEHVNLFLLSALGDDYQWIETNDEEARYLILNELRVDPEGDTFSGLIRYVKSDFSVMVDWAYVDRDVHTFGDNEVDGGEYTYVYDFDFVLKAGWNRLVFTMSKAETTETTIGRVGAEPSNMIWVFDEW